MPPIDPAWAGQVQFYELLFGTWTVYIFLVLMWERRVWRKTAGMALRAPQLHWRWRLLGEPLFPVRALLADPDQPLHADVYLGVVAVGRARSAEIRRLEDCRHPGLSCLHRRVYRLRADQSRRGRPLWHARVLLDGIIVPRLRGCDHLARQSAQKPHLNNAIALWRVRHRCAGFVPYIGCWP